MSIIFFATCLMITMATSAASAISLRAHVMPLTSASYYVATIYSDSGCTVAASGSAALLNYCLSNSDGTYTKYSSSGSSTLTTTTYSDSACSTVSGSPSVGNLYASCTATNTAGVYLKSIVQSSPSFISSTAGVTLSEFISGDISCSSIAYLSSYYPINVCSNQVLVTISGSAITGKVYGTADCSGAVQSTISGTNLGCAASQTGGVGYEMATYSGAPTAAPTLVPTSAPTTASYFVATYYSDSSCTVVSTGVAFLLNYCSSHGDGTYSKLTSSGSQSYTQTTYSDSACSTVLGTPSVSNFPSICFSTLTVGQYLKYTIQSSPLFISSTAGVTFSEFISGDTSCSSDAYLLSYYRTNVCSNQVLVTISGSTVTRKSYSTADCSGASSTLEYHPLGCAESQFGGYEMATYSGAPTAAPTIAPTAAATAPTAAPTTAPTASPTPAPTSAPTTASYFMATIYSDSSCTAVMSGTAQLINYCSASYDGTSSKFTSSGSQTLTTTTYSDSACSTILGTPSLNTYYPTCFLSGTVGQYLKYTIQSAPFISSTAGVTFSEFISGDTSCSSDAYLLSYYRTNVCSNQVLVTISGSTVTRKSYSTADCSGASSTLVYQPLGCAESQFGGYEMATYSGAPTAAPTIAPTAAATAPTAAPTKMPTPPPTHAPTAAPTLVPTSAPTTASYSVNTFYSDSGCTIAISGSAELLNYCLPFGDGTYTKYSSSGSSITVVDYYDSACTMIRGYPSVSNSYTSCSLFTAGQYRTSSVQSSPSFISSTAGITLSEFISGDTSCSRNAYLLSYYPINVCSNQALVTISGSAITGKVYGTADCSGAVQSTISGTNLGCAASQTGGVGYERATYLGAPTAAPTLVPIAAPATTSTTSSCFAGSETVIMESGDVKAVSEVQIGDRVLAADAAGKTLFSDVVFVPHGANKESATFTHISTANGRDVKMTLNHILPAGVCGSSSSLPLVYASEVSVGDCIQTVSGEEKVSMVEHVRGEGVYTIVTKEEFIVVNGIIASPFGANHMMANMFYNVHRFVYASAPVLLTSALLHSANEVRDT